MYQQFSTNSKENQRHYMIMARHARHDGLVESRRTFIAIAWKQRQNSRQWAQMANSVNDFIPH